MSSDSLGVLGFQTTALQSREDRLIQSASGARTNTDGSKIDKGAKEFETVLIGNWLQQAEQSFATIPGADDDDDSGGNQMMSLGVQSLATSIAASGGIGIGKMIANAMHHLADKQDASTSAPAVLASDKKE